MNMIVYIFGRIKIVNDKKVFIFVSMHFYMSPKAKDTAVQISKKKGFKDSISLLLLLLTLSYFFFFKFYLKT